ncbi:hypothetical protein [Bacteroides fragilis]|uniref:hypothetical protein n=1 Tax=Bacteroides fragilis TaxID=817 RepID=UPI0020CB6752|nr:hypothetical protein [Bacteroides fragilis]
MSCRPRIVAEYVLDSVRSAGARVITLYPDSTFACGACLHPPTARQQASITACFTLLTFSIIVPI